MSVSDGFFACGFFVYVSEREVYFDEFLAVIWHVVRWFVVVNRYRIIDYFWCWGIYMDFLDFLGMVLVFHPLPALWILP